MRSGRTAFLKIAFALCGAGAVSFLRAADSAPAPAAAPEKIEFSGASSTSPKVPRPGAKNDELLNRFGNVREVAPMAPDMGVPMTTVNAAPSRAAAEKMMREWDKKRNWMFPEAQEMTDASQAFTKKDDDKDLDPLGEKPKTVTERFFEGDSKSKTEGPKRLRDLDDDRQDNLNSNSNNRDRNLGDRDDKKDRRDPNEAPEANGLAEFNLKNFIRQQDGQETFLKDNPLPRASELFRSEIGAAPQLRKLEKQRAEREARAADFMQILKPRSTGGFSGVNDPINSPDLSGRAMNPVTPRPLESAITRSPFAAPPSTPAARIQENNMFGVTGPAAAVGAAPIVNNPLPRPEPIPSRQIVIEPPKRPFN
jgi:hypothetical protein